MEGRCDTIVEYHDVDRETARLGEDGQGENVDRPERSRSTTGGDPPAGERYLLLADISGYTGFMAGVEQEHGVDFSAGIPAAP